MSRIDYSKWDHLEDSDDDASEDQLGDNVPRVTKLEQPSRITTQADGSLLVQPQTNSSHTESKTNEPTAKSSAAMNTTASIPSEWTDKGDYVILSKDRELFWSQDRYSVTLRIALPFEMKMKIKTVQVEGTLPYSERNMATGSQLPRLCVHGDGDSSTVWFHQCELPHPVHLAEDENEIDWTVVSHNHVRYLTIVLYKATPMPGMFLWWKRPLTNCPERPLENDEEISQSSLAFQRAWNDAQQQFTENSKTRTQHLVG